jgi:hypothetical protein
MEQASISVLAVAPREEPRGDNAQKAGHAVGLFISLLVACALLLTLAVLLLRVRWRRAHLRRAIGLGAEPASSAPRVDAWSEAARRIEVEGGGDDGGEPDTVDIDPSDLGPDDIEPFEPPEPPQHGRGR